MDIKEIQYILTSSNHICTTPPMNEWLISFIFAKYFCITKSQMIQFFRMRKNMEEIFINQFIMQNFIKFSWKWYYVVLLQLSFYRVKFKIIEDTRAPDNPLDGCFLLFKNFKKILYLTHFRPSTPKWYALVFPCEISRQNLILQWKKMYLLTYLHIICKNRWNIEFLYCNY